VRGERPLEKKKKEKTEVKVRPFFSVYKEKL